ncbi:hypothetical protein Dsin_010728 [Dipteronia sinensis]|uniref:RNA helicase aquarius N-terminal domain-containing protein n=1 Tax=Dipteronia sinensis TaxID=43782 RepID=A0AAE0ECU9_9ROSI|nr:hypothetical protein Dsin_010728 [Dipteronia sinensis]
MILEVSQFFENYLWPYFEAATASFEHVMSMILMVNEKEAFRGFLERVIRLKEGRDLTIAEKTNYLVFTINAFQRLEDEIVSETVLRLASLQSWHSLSYGPFLGKMELCLNPDLIRRWRRMIKREAKEATKQESLLTPHHLLNLNFEKSYRRVSGGTVCVLDHKVFPQKHSTSGDDLMNVDGFYRVDDACALYCERFMEFLIDLLSQPAYEKVS